MFHYHIITEQKFRGPILLMILHFHCDLTCWSYVQWTLFTYLFYMNVKTVWSKICKAQVIVPHDLQLKIFMKCWKLLLQYQLMPYKKNLNILRKWEYSSLWSFLIIKISQCNVFSLASRETLSLREKKEFVWGRLGSGRSILKSVFWRRILQTLRTMLRSKLILF